MSKPIETNGTPELAVECQKWEKQCAELLAERERMCAELAKVKSERDSYLKTVYHFMCKDYTPPDLTKEQIFALVRDEPTFEETIAELKRESAQE